MATAGTTAAFHATGITATANITVAVAVRPSAISTSTPGHSSIR